MNPNKLKFIDVLSARKAYLDGKNVTTFLRNHMGVEKNTPEIIELAYDIQAGSYIEFAKNNRPYLERYASEVVNILQHYSNGAESFLDVGTGEMTTLAAIINLMNDIPEEIYAFDISWSRVHKGISYAKDHMNIDENRIFPFVADISEIPLHDNSISVITSNHALEPNGGRLESLMAELFRVAKDIVILFEPCYEINSDEGKKRMDELGYIKNVDGVIDKMGGTLFDKIAIKNISNPLNPTACYVIYPPKKSEFNRLFGEKGINRFSVPGTDLQLDRIDDLFFSKNTGLTYPIIKSIPVLKSSAAVLTSSLVV